MSHIAFAHYHLGGKSFVRTPAALAESQTSVSLLASTIMNIGWGTHLLHLMPHGKGSNGGLSTMLLRALISMKESVFRE